jgi:hypothetical protein
VINEVIVHIYSYVFKHSLSLHKNNYLSLAAEI